METVLVIGATGQQGGSVARHLIQSQRFKVRALVRNPKKKSAVHLEKIGVELFQGDLSKAHTLTELLNDVDYVFMNTIWDLMSETPQHEIDRGKNIIDLIVAKSNQKATATVKHVFYSSIPALPGNEEAASKQEIERYLKQKLASPLQQGNKISYTIIYPVFFLENFTTLWPLFRHSFSRALYWCTLPLKNDRFRMHSIAIEDLGGIVLGLLENKTEMEQRDSLMAVADDVFLSDILTVFSTVLQEHVAFEPLTLSQFRCLPFPKSAREVLEWYSTMDTSNNGAIQKYQQQASEDLKLCKQLFPKLQDTQQWATKHKQELLGCFNEQNDPDGKRKQMKTGMWLFKEYAICREFVTRSSVIVSGLVVIVGVGVYFWKRKQAKVATFLKNVNIRQKLQNA